MIGTTERLLPLENSSRKKKKVTFAEGLSEKNSKNSNSNSNNNSISSDNFIFYDSKQKFSERVEFYASLNSNKDTKILIVVGKDTSFDFLSIKIAECMEAQIGFLSNLDGLRAINLVKKNVKNELIQISPEVEPMQYISNGDTVYCDLASEEYWINVKIDISISNKEFRSVTFDFKCRKEQFIRRLINLMLKFTFYFFINISLRKKNTFHYIIDSLSFQLENLKNEASINLVYGKDDEEINKLCGSRVSDIFDFNSKIKLGVNLVSLENLLFEELKNIKNKEKYHTKKRWADYRGFESIKAMYESGLFFPEFNFITKFVDTIFSSSIYKNQSISDLFHLYDTKQGYVEESLQEETAEKIIVLHAELKEKSPSNEERSILGRKSFSKKKNKSKADGRSSSYTDLSVASEGFSTIENPTRYNEEEPQNEVRNESVCTSEYLGQENMHINSKVISEINDNSQESSFRIVKLRNISKYGNLYKEFSKLYKEKKFIDMIQSKRTLRFNGVAIERLLLPEYRKTNISKFLKEGSEESENTNERRSSRLMRDVINQFLIYSCIVTVAMIVLVILIICCINKCI